MKCEKCNKREATTHMTKIVDGYKEEHHLCAECAANMPEYKEMKSKLSFGVGDFLTGMLTGGKQTAIGQENSAGVCPTCGMSYDEFLKRGKLGCGDCYTAFKNRIKRPIKQIHGTLEHVGKVPKRNGGSLMTGRRIAALEAELNAAVMKQDFETAAKLRDEIRDLKNGNKNDSDTNGNVNTKESQTGKEA